MLTMKTARTLPRRGAQLGIVASFVAILLAPTQGMAALLLGDDLASFTVLGASTVTNVPASTIVGNVGVWSSGGANAITGFTSSPGVAVSDPQVTGGKVHAGTGLAESAQGQLTAARINLDSLGLGTLLPADLSTLITPILPGVYTVPEGITNLSGAVTLDGLGDANAAWVFQMETTLITSPDAVMNLIGAGSGAGVFWNVRSSATIDVNTKFLGNILAATSITLNSFANTDTSATNICGRVLADTGAVTLDQNTLSSTCTGVLADSNGLGGGLDVLDVLDASGAKVGEKVVFLSPTPTAVPEPGTFLLFGFGLAGLLVIRKRSLPAA